MNATQLLAHFDRLAEAPNAVPRLRRFILDLAVRGKLVEQDAGDEPAAELLNRIRTDKLQFGNGRSSKPDLGEVKEVAEPFELPEHWIWTNLGDIADLVRGITFSAADKSTTHVNGTLPCFRSGNIQNEIVWGDFVFVPKSVLKSAAQLVRANDILISIANSYELVGKSSIVTTVQQEATFGAFLTAIRLFLLPPQFIQHVLASGYSASAFRIGSSQTTNIANITFGTIRGHQIPLPPLAEQHRIVAKVDELMALCDQLEAAQQERERRRDRLAAASLQRLNQPAADTTPEAQREHARFHLHHLPRLTTRPEHIKAMRQSIFNFAVRGWLLPQNCRDENAAALFAGIQIEKNRLIREAVIKPYKQHAPFNAEDIPYILPAPWMWTRLSDLADVQDPNPSHRMPLYVPSGGEPFISSENFAPNDQIDFTVGKQVDRKTLDDQIARFPILPGAFGFTRIGTIGKSRLLPLDRTYAISHAVCVVNPIDSRSLSMRFLRLTMSSEVILGAAHKGVRSVGVPDLGMAVIRAMPIPLPPLAEQHRIVAKVDELMVLCDQLEAQLATTQTNSRRLLESILEAALTPV